MRGYQSLCNVRTPGAHNYRIIGLEFMNQENVDRRLNGGFINLDGREEPSLSNQSNHIVVDRVYIHGPSTPGSTGVKFGIVFGGQHQAVIDSTIEGLISNDGEAKAIAGWVAGPWLIDNNFLSASGENIMIGGATPLINGLTPSDIEIIHNHFYKTLEWRDNAPLLQGHNKVLTKNLLELKNAQRVLIDGNVFENVWPDGQTGYAVVFTPKTGSVGSTDHRWSIG